MKKVIFTILLVAVQAVFSKQDTTFKDQDAIISLIEDYFAHVDNKDIDGMYRFFAMPLVLHFNADQPYHIKDKEEFDAIFNAWKRSPNSNFHSTRIDSIRVNNAFANYFCVADVTFSRLDRKGNPINRQRVLYNLVKGGKYGPLGLLIKWFMKWKIYMITNVEMVE
jgi:ketosteroid isomerase-like protein